MTIPVGTRLGPYEILAPIGAGGMGEVYRARDPKLQRDVAIKVLSELFASDAGRRARFEREAQGQAQQFAGWQVGLVGRRRPPGVTSAASDGPGNPERWRPAPSR